MSSSGGAGGPGGGDPAGAAEAARAAAVATAAGDATTKAATAQGNAIAALATQHTADLGLFVSTGSPGLKVSRGLVPPAGPVAGDLWADEGSAIPGYALATDLATATATLDAAAAKKADFPNGPWTPYTPVLTGGTWAFGNAVVTAGWVQFGKTVHFRIQIVWGSSSVFDPAGSPALSLPTPRRSAHPQTFPANANDVSAGTFYGLLALAQVAGTFMVATMAAPAALVTSVVPFTWASGDWLNVGGTYERA